MNRILLILGIALTVIACNNDDDTNVIAVPVKTLTEVVAENEVEIADYLATHTYNYEDFEGGATDATITIQELTGDNAGKTPLADLMQTVNINVSSSHFGLEEEENDVSHKLYYLEVVEGGGVNPTYADSTLLKYEGMLLNGTKFDASNEFTWLELPFTVRGFANGAAQFKTGTTDGIVANPDGTTNISNSGKGIVIMPAGLAYFLSNNTIPSYAPLVFTLEIGLTVEDTDTDRDGIPNLMEDLNGNGYMFDDNTDSDLERSNFTTAVPNFRDSDDDGDGTSTRDEIVIDANGNITLTDSNNDGVPDYLDPDTF